MTDPIIINLTTMWLSVLIISLSGIIASIHFINRFWICDTNGYANIQEKYWTLTHWILCGVIVFGAFGVIYSLGGLGLYSWCINGIFTVWNVISSNLPTVIIK